MVSLGIESRCFFWKVIRLLVLRVILVLGRGVWFVGNLGDLGIGFFRWLFLAVLFFLVILLCFLKCRLDIFFFSLLFIVGVEFLFVKRSYRFRFFCCRFGCWRGFVFIFFNIVGIFWMGFEDWVVVLRILVGELVFKGFFFGFSFY